MSKAFLNIKLVYSNPSIHYLEVKTKAKIEIGVKAQVAPPASLSCPKNLMNHSINNLDFSPLCFSV